MPDDPSAEAKDELLEAEESDEGVDGVPADGGPRLEGGRRPPPLPSAMAGLAALSCWPHAESAGAGNRFGGRAAEAAVAAAAAAAVVSLPSVSS